MSNYQMYDVLTAELYAVYQPLENNPSWVGLCTLAPSHFYHSLVRSLSTLSESNNLASRNSHNEAQKSS